MRSVARLRIVLGLAVLLVSAAGCVAGSSGAASPDAGQEAGAPDVPGAADGSGESAADAWAPDPRRPARIFGMLNRHGDGASPIFLPSEIAAIGSNDNFALLAGLDGHGYSIESSPIAEVRKRGFSNPALCFVTGSTMELPRGQRFADLDDVETAFLHSADPASAALVHDEKTGGIVLHFRQDMRLAYHYTLKEDYRDPSKNTERKPITAYVVRAASGGPASPYVDVVGTIPVSDSDPYRFYAFEVPYGFTDRDRWLKVLSRYADGREVDYSEPLNFWVEGGNLGNVDDARKSGFVDLVVRPPTGKGPGDLAYELSTLCADGYTCPEADDLAVVMRSPGGTYDPSTLCVVDASGVVTNPGCRAIRFQVRTPASGGHAYRASVRFVSSTKVYPLTSYRLVRLSTAGVLAPLATVAGKPAPGGYGLNNLPGVEIIGVNNRITTSSWGGLVVRMDSPGWIDTVKARLSKCRGKGYDGIFLDFTWDTIKDFWFSVSALPPGYDEAAYAESGLSLIKALKAAFPAAPVGFNGVANDKFAANNRRKVAAADLVAFEAFYATHYGVYSGSKLAADLGVTLDYSVGLGRKVLLMPELPNDKTVTDLVELLRRNVRDHRNRIGSFASYLLASNPNVFFSLEIYNGGPYRLVKLFPEWKVPLGPAVVAKPSMKDLAPPGRYPPGILSRAFENGEVLMNLGTAPVKGIAVGTPAFRLRLIGGLDPASKPAAGEAVPPGYADLFDGSAAYDAVGTLDLDPLEAAILLRKPAP